MSANTHNLLPGGVILLAALALATGAGAQTSGGPSAGGAAGKPPPASGATQSLSSRDRGELALADEPAEAASETAAEADAPVESAETGEAPAGPAGGATAEKPTDAPSPEKEAKTGTPKDADKGKNPSHEGSEGTPFPFGGDAPNLNLPWLQMLASVLLIAVVGVVGYVVAKRVLPRLRRQGAGRLAVEETVHLGPGKSVHLMRVGARTFLVASTKDSVSLLSEVPAPPQAPPPAEEGTA